MNPIYFAIPLVFLFLYILFTSDQYTSLEIIVCLLFVAIIAMIGTQYFLGVNLTATLENIFDKPKVDISIVQQIKDKIKPHPKPPKPDHPHSGKEQVYHVQGQFDYKNAKAVCKAYNGKLATFQQISSAYENGAEWCDYGWSDDKMALYPTQKDSWASYQDSDDPEQCGRPGINGGYNHHISQLLGSNCFGEKPPQHGPLPPPPIQHKKIDERAEYWKQNSKVSPFNYTNWSI